MVKLIAEVSIFDTKYFTVTEKYSFTSCNLILQMSKKDLEGLNGLSNSVNDLRERLKNDFYGQNENRNSSSDR